MNSPVIAFQPAAGNLLGYNLTLPATDISQSGDIPQIFRDAMTVRETVFVREQRAVPLQHHIDRDDARSCHWALYWTPTHKPIGTVRLVPAPHHPHPEPGAKFEAPGEDIPSTDAKTLFSAPLPLHTQDRVTSLHDGKELFVKLGRLCIVQEFRGHHYADLLIQEALSWVKKNPEFAAGETGMDWNGLVGIHAQEGAVRTWERNGFVVDEAMGTWFEGGIRHLGMFQRL